MNEVNGIDIYKAIEIVKKWEGLKLESYLCPAKVWTIGYGSTWNFKKGRAVKKGDVWTEEESEKYLIETLKSIALDILKETNTNKETMPNYCLAALISFSYNLGDAGDDLQNQRFKNKEFDLMCEKWPLYCNIIKNGEKISLDGLKKRRLDELYYFKIGLEKIKQRKIIYRKATKKEIDLMPSKYLEKWEGFTICVFEFYNKTIFYSVTGQKNKQIFAPPKGQIAGNMQPIPSGIYRLGNYVFGDFGAVGTEWCPLIPTFEMKRGSFGIHLENNINGSAGCALLYDKKDSTEFCTHMENLKCETLEVIW